MFSIDVRNKLQNIIQGTVIEEQADSCAAVRNYLCTSFVTSPTTNADFESKQRIKEEQVDYLTNLAAVNNLWIPEILTDWTYLTEGGEAKVFMVPSQQSVIKVNDAVYYATWLEYFNSLTIHNLLFPETAYDFIGFHKLNGRFSAVAKQPFVASDEMLICLQFANY